MNALKTLLATCLLATCAAAGAQSTDNCPILEVTGLKADQGHLMLAVYGSADQFFKKPVFDSKTEVKGDTARIPVCNLAATEIAVTGFQDLNGNNKMDFNPFGIPTEPYGASGKPPKFSSPTWDTSKVAWPPADGKSVTVKF